jgi:SAM-dependent methyltransferase
MTANLLGRRTPLRRRPVDISQFQTWIEEDLRAGRWFPLFDLVEEGVSLFPRQTIPILAMAHGLYQIMRSTHGDRYHLYQGRFFEFPIFPGEKVLDLGSGHHPFPLATVLSDISVADGSIGRAGAKFENPRGLPVHEFPVERIPFADGEFDFLYCSHVLEHSTDPERACSEIQRVARRGYIETPTAHKDLWLGSAKPSNHTTSVEWENDSLLFRPYSPEEIDGLGTDILGDMGSNPQNDREKALSATIYLKADRINTMVYWERRFRYCVKRSATEIVDEIVPVRPTAPTPDRSSTPRRARPVFLQVHTFYGAYLADFYGRRPELANAGHARQIEAILEDGFSQVHMFAPAMAKEGYDGTLVIPNDPVSQMTWWKENETDPLPTGPVAHERILARQVERLRPDVLYVADPIQYHKPFFDSLAWRPPTVVGWRAADIPPGIDWSGLDLFLSGLAGVREHARRIGARRTEHFYPGFDPAQLETNPPVPDVDVVFCGSINPSQHMVRGQILEEMVRQSRSSAGGFSLRYHLNAAPGTLSPILREVDSGPVFGREMLKATRRGRLTVDIRGNIRNGAIGDPTLRKDFDLARNETMNMRIFEATGCGVFLLAEHYDNVREYFRSGWEIETFRDAQEMFDKIRFYLRHPDLREAIARRGQERCLRDHSMARRANAFAKLLSNLPERPNHG